MLDNRRGISYQETVDPQACNLNETNNWRDASRDPQRTPFQWDDSKWSGFSSGNTKPWLPIHPNFHELNLKAQKSFERSTYKFYLELSKLRKDHILIYGDFKATVVGQNVLAYSRYVSISYIMIIIIFIYESISIFIQNIERTWHIRVPHELRCSRRDNRHQSSVQRL